MSVFKGRRAVREIMFYGAAACAVLLLASFGSSRPTMAAGNMGDPSAATRANAAAYPEFFAPKPDLASQPPANRVQRCKTPPGPMPTDGNCLRR